MNRYYELSKTFANPEYEVMMDGEADTVCEAEQDLITTMHDAELDLLRHNTILKAVDRYRRVTELALLAQLRETPEN